MKRILKLAVLTVVVCCAAGPALANIPAHVDFWAEQTVDSQGTIGPWTIHVETGLDYNRYGYKLPVWETPNMLRIDNDYVPDNTKQLWVEIWFTVAPDKDLGFPGVAAKDDVGQSIGNITELPRNLEPITDATWSWIIFPQPAVEWVDFSEWVTGSGGSMASFDLDGDGFLDIEKIEVGTYCVPTPSSLLLCGIGIAFAAVGKRFRRRK